MNVVILDARPSEAYAAGHLEGAIHADLETQLSAPGDPAKGGRHPLPPLERWLAQVAEWGITPSTQVIVYDDADGANAAARVWWMLRAIGHENVSVRSAAARSAEVRSAEVRSAATRSAATRSAGILPAAPLASSRHALARNPGRLEASVAAGWKPALREPALREPALREPALRAAAVGDWQLPTVTLSEVDRLRNDPSWRVLDVRSRERFRGETEPIDPVAGHIPGAINLPYTENTSKTPDELRRMYDNLLGGIPPERLVVHCGSGVTACHTLLALERAGLHGASLYVGSWGEWCRNEMPVGKS